MMVPGRSSKSILRVAAVFLTVILMLLLLTAVAATGSAADDSVVTTATNPSNEAIQTMLYNAAVARGIPPEILYGIAWQESGWRQFNSNGDPLMSADGYGSIGIMQVTPSSCGGCNVDSLKWDINYNINAGADILIGKWSWTPSIGDDDMNCYENWFYAVWAYNGWVANNSYPYTVWSHIASGAYGRWAGVPVTAVPHEWLPGGIGVQIPTPQPAHYFSTPDNKPYKSYFTWYDNISSQNWVLMSNPSGSPGNSSFALSVSGKAMSVGALPGLATGDVPPGQVLSARYANLIGGPVIVGATQPPVVSQRILWAGNSLEEVLGVEENDLSSHYYWPWYDMASPGYKDWVLVANPQSAAVTVQIRVAGNLAFTATLNPGERVTPTFPGWMGGPLEVTATAPVIASQRVLSNNDRAFNEVPGIPVEELSDYYTWTWYDNASPGATDWVVVANPGSRPVDVNVRIAGNLVAGVTLNAGEHRALTFPGWMGGPVEVYAGGLVIASQRVVWGPSFEEVPGYRVSQLKSHYTWTWYDNASRGATNWVLVANPGSSPVTYQVRIAGGLVASGTLNAGQRVTPTFPGTMAGPLEVTASGPVMASQRVIWNGYFNEVLGAG